MKIASVFIQISLIAILASEARAWRGDTEAFNGAIGEYVRTLKKSYKEDGTLTRGSSMLQRGLKKSGGKGGKGGSKSNKTPAPTQTMAPTCPPSSFVAAPSKRSKSTKKIRNSSKKETKKSAKSCKATSAPVSTLVPTCAPTPIPTMAPTKLGSKSKSSKTKTAKVMSFSCKSGKGNGSTSKKLRRTRMRV
jgi:hypothetical protein